MTRPSGFGTFPWADDCIRWFCVVWEPRFVTTLHIGGSSFIQLSNLLQNIYSHIAWHDKMYDSEVSQEVKNVEQLSFILWRRYFV